MPQVKIYCPDALFHNDAGGRDDFVRVAKETIAINLSCRDDAAQPVNLSAENVDLIMIEVACCAWRSKLAMIIDIAGIEYRSRMGLIEESLKAIKGRLARNLEFDPEQVRVRFIPSPKQCWA